MSAVQISGINPINLTAVVSTSAPYTVTLFYGTSNVGDGIIDSYSEIPNPVVVNITSGSLAPGDYLEGRGGATTWTTNSATSITGSFTYPAAGGSHSFTVVVTDGTTIRAQHDPRLTLRKTSTEDRA